MLKRIVVVLSLLLAFNAKADDRWADRDMDLLFTKKFFKTAFEDKKDNFVVSPLSVYTATLLLANGTEGDSRKELDEILPRLNIDDINREISDYIKQKKDSIQITNTIVGDSFNPEYENKVRDELFAKVEHQSNSGKLELINNVVFNDKWETPFKVERTKVEDFYSLDGTTDKVDMMHAYRRNVDYYQNEKMQAVRLPYKNGNVMHIFLPKEGIDFNEFVQKMDANDLFLLYRSVPVDISIPRFKGKFVEVTQDENGDMISYYKRWGINGIFNGGEDLIKLCGTECLVKSITHEADIITTESGTEAKAKTRIEFERAMVVEDWYNMMEPKEWKIFFNANRPFIFMINNGDFIGAYVKGKRFELKKKNPCEGVPNCISMGYTYEE